MSTSGSEAGGETPFWMEGAIRYPVTGSPIKNPAAWIAVLISAYRLIFYGSTLVLLVVLALLNPWLWTGVAIWVGILVLILLAVRRGARLRKRIMEVQQRAKLQTGALQIGSTLHTAGHPLLQVDEPVVLALKPGDLSIHNYASPIPIDTILILSNVIVFGERLPNK